MRTGTDKRFVNFGILFTHPDRFKACVPKRIVSKFILSRDLINNMSTLSRMLNEIPKMDHMQCHPPLISLLTKP